MTEDEPVPDLDTVVVPRWALRFILRNAHLVDCAYSGEGWTSEEMDRAVAAVEAAMKDRE